jgi:hypothetical protein
MLAPIALIKATLDGMIARRFGRIANVTSHAVKGARRDAGAVQRPPVPVSPASSRGSRARLPNTM